MQSVQLAQLRWTGHVTRILTKGCQKKFSMENCRKESAQKVAMTNATKDALKASLKDFNIPTESWGTGWIGPNKKALPHQQRSLLHRNSTVAPRVTKVTSVRGSPNGTI